MHPGGVRTSTNLSVLYPDAVSQMWVVAFGLADRGRAKSLVTRFQAAHPEWDRPAATHVGRRRGLGPGRLLGAGCAGRWLAPVTGARSTLGVQRIRSAAELAGRGWPFTPADAGQVILGGAGFRGFGVSR